MNNEVNQRLNIFISKQQNRQVEVYEDMELVDEVTDYVDHLQKTFKHNCYCPFDVKKDEL